VKSGKTNRLIVFFFSKQHQIPTLQLQQQQPQENTIKKTQQKSETGLFLDFSAILSRMPTTRACFFGRARPPNN